MANKPQDMNELVPFFAFRDNDKYKDDIFVGWNGKGYQIQRGKQVMIPRGVLSESLSRFVNAVKRLNAAKAG